MKVTIPSNILRTILTGLSCCRSKYFQLSSNGKQATFTASNFDERITATAGTPDGEGSLNGSVPGLKQLAKHWPTGSVVELSTNGDDGIMVMVQGYPFRHYIECDIDCNTIPLEITGDSTAINIDDLFTLKKASICVGIDTGRIQISHICIEPGLIVATDGRVMLVNKSSIAVKSQVLLLPTRFLQWTGWRWPVEMTTSERVPRVPAVTEGPIESRVTVKPEIREIPGYIQLKSGIWSYIQKRDYDYPKWRCVADMNMNVLTTIDIHKVSVEYILKAIPMLPKNKDESVCLQVTHEKFAFGFNNYADVEATVKYCDASEHETWMRREYFAKALRYGFTKIELQKAGEIMIFSNENGKMMIMPVNNKG